MGGGRCLFSFVFMCMLSHCCAQLFVAPWTIACQAPLCMGFPRQKYWSGLPFPFSGNFPDPGIEPESPALVRAPEGGNSNPLQYSCLGNPMHRGAWQAIVHGVAKSQT